MLRNLLKLSSITRINGSHTISRNIGCCSFYWLNVPTPYDHKQNKFIYSDEVRKALLRAPSFNVLKDSVRFKSKRPKSKGGQYDSDSDEEDSDEINSEGYDEEGNKLKGMRIKSLRIDSVTQKCLGFTRRKMDELFFEKKLRYNGKPLPKKSVEIREGDCLEVCTDPVDTGATTETVTKMNIINIKPLQETSNYILTFSIDKRK